MRLTELLDQIDRLDQGASEAPWQQATDTYDGSEYKTGEVYAEAGTERMQRKFDRMDPDIRCDHGPDAEFIALARTALPAMSKALRDIMEIHKPFHADHYYNGMDGESLHRFVLRCDGCEESGGIEDYPCPTVQAITDALGADDD